MSEVTSGWSAAYGARRVCRRRGRAIAGASEMDLRRATAWAPRNGQGSFVCIRVRMGVMTEGKARVLTFVVFLALHRCLFTTLSRCARRRQCFCPGLRVDVDPGHVRDLVDHRVVRSRAPIPGPPAELPECAGSWKRVDPATNLVGSVPGGGGESLEERTQFGPPAGPPSPPGHACPGPFSVRVAGDGARDSCGGRGFYSLQRLDRVSGDGGSGGAGGALAAAFAYWETCAEPKMAWGDGAWACLAGHWRSRPCCSRL